MPRRTGFLAAASLILALTAGGAAEAVDFTVGDLSIEDPWARATAGTAANGAAYMTISTRGDSPDKLVAAASPAAARVELHTHILDEGIMRMRAVNAIEVNVGEPAVLKPGGLHVMLLGLKAPLKEGETFPLTLTFEKAGSVTVAVSVAGPGAGGHHQHGM